MDEVASVRSTRKRWFQYSLRSLLLAMLVVAVTMPFLVERTHGVALEGCCPVILADSNRWSQGDPNIAETYQGLIYHFAGAREREAFVHDPEKYALAASGYDAVVAKEAGRKVLGKRRYGFRYRGRAYLLADRASMEKFQASPAEYVKFADAWNSD